MQLKDTITPSVLAAAVGLLQPFCPDLSPRSLVRAIKSYQAEVTTATDATPEKPLTRKEAAAILGVSLQSVSRYMNDGRLKRISLSKKCVRVCPQSLRDLLAGNAANAESEG
jgi:hypothetical protein